jgi:hypothetical protein
MAKHKNFVTPVMKTSYTNVFEPKEGLNGKMQYSTALLIDKTDEEGIKEIRQAIMSAAKEKFGEDKAKWPKPLDNPLRDGDDKPDLAAYQGCFYMNPKSDYKPQVVGPNLKPIMDEEQFYSGVFCRAQVNFYGYTWGGKSGIGVGLSNLMKVKDGERLDNRENADKAFAAFKTDDEPEEAGADSADDEFFE